MPTIRVDDVKIVCILFPFFGTPGRCDVCGSVLTGRRTVYCSTACSQVYQNNHYWTAARRLAKRRDKYKCVRCGEHNGLEVNHIIPLIGAGYQSSCAHHQTNLETLCHQCHLVVTAHQRAVRGSS